MRAMMNTDDTQDRLTDLEVKASFTEDAIIANVRTFIDSVMKARPSGAKGIYWRTVYIKSTMGPSIRVNVSALRDIKMEVRMRPLHVCGVSFC